MDPLKKSLKVSYSFYFLFSYKQSNFNGNLPKAQIGIIKHKNKNGRKSSDLRPLAD
ncbi:hypothetical protein CYK57_02254 [Actinobacillus pleuropneumoniae]|uniref:Uncharacterized protein n=1 Tax=Actinobacillus pleuropneumoniae serovar 6 str. Femo TaxID=754256 RepID=A0A828PGU5_ACTPL|nr:hypothetical protein appser2_19960 [Actinobacillus pleuropneumoniae serovar 2 str. S1536]EFM88883.1 hypothetical protein appser4_19930 [Actinobacillus pleuropneumoniae serovar 4 str. M62]EFM90931.1 hypothetical protein appser6_21410 [Actinobacillus pleuropneumoniae serovar 6 str. Femo]EFM93140.1 hypothetical protein appser9_21000 [Actinobacillus pleuropneumoniae serovar 9 str. CVJ13261]EFM95358.1 hypothetical protein appser10_20440 [Actinobacillus pleuropneumoniae serovar 10 str. D13039]EFM